MGTPLFHVQTLQMALAAAKCGCVCVVHVMLNLQQACIAIVLPLPLLQAHHPPAHISRLLTVNNAGKPSQ